MTARQHLLVSWLVVLFCVHTVAIGNPQAPPLRADEERRRLDEQIAILRDTSGRLGIDEVAAPAMAERFVALDRGVALGLTRDVVWLRIALRRAADAASEWRLEPGNAVIDDLRFYGPDGRGGNQLLAQAGSRHPLAGRDCLYRHPLFTVILADSAEQFFYLRVESTSAIALALTLWQSAAFRLAVQSELLTIGVAFGIVAMTILSSLLGGLAIRSTRHLQLMACSLFFFAFLATALGLTAQYVFPSQPALAGALHRINVCLVPVTILVLTRKALRLREYAPRLDAWCRRLMALGAVELAAIAVGEYRSAEALAYLSILLATALAVGGSWLAWRQRRAGAEYFLVAAIGFALPSSYTTLTALGVIDGARWIEASLVAGVVSYCLFVQLGLLVDVKSIHAESLRISAARASDRALAAQERRLREEQTRFFAFVAHELRNPLGVIVSGVANLRVGLAGAGEAMQQRVARVANAARRLADLIDRNLRLQRIAHPDFSADDDACPPGFPAEQACAQIAESYPGRCIAYAIATDLPAEIMVDAELVTLAIVNLLDNAIKYSPPASPVALTVCRDAAYPQMIVYRVVDDGPGIASADQHCLFDLYARPGGKGHSGFGIGLALVANVAHCHGGSVECRSSPGMGATFELRLRIVLPPDSERS